MSTSRDRGYGTDKETSRGTVVIKKVIVFMLWVEIKKYIDVCYFMLTVGLGLTHCNIDSFLFSIEFCFTRYN